MNAVHGREALESVVVTVQDELDAVFSGNGQEQPLQFQPIVKSAAVIKAMQAAGVDRNMEEKDFPGLRRRGQVVREPPILRSAVAQIVSRKQRVLKAHRHKQRAEMNVARVERIKMLRPGGGIGRQIKCL